MTSFFASGVDWVLTFSALLEKLKRVQPWPPQQQQHHLINYSMHRIIAAQEKHTLQLLNMQKILHSLLEFKVNDMSHVYKRAAQILFCMFSVHIALQNTENTHTHTQQRNEHPMERPMNGSQHPKNSIEASASLLFLTCKRSRIRRKTLHLGGECK